MALITDPDLLADSAADDNSTEVFIDTSALTIKLNTGVGDLIAADGVTEKAVYSFLKEAWKNDPLTKNLAAFDFPMVPITDEFYELVDGWNWADAETRESIRRGGWLVRNTSGNVTEHWAGLAILNAESDDQIYYDQGTGATNFTFTGNTAEAIQVISDPNGDGNYAEMVLLMLRLIAGCRLPSTLPLNQEILVVLIETLESLLMATTALRLRYMSMLHGRCVKLTIKMQAQAH